MIKFRNRLRLRGLRIIPLVALLSVVGSVAHAIDASSPITLSNGTIALGTVGVGNGGTNITTYSEHDVIVATAADTVAAAALPASCSASDKALTYNTATHAFGCNTIAAGTTIYPVLAFTSESPIDVDSAGTEIFIGLGGRVSGTEANVETPVRTGILANLSCKASAAPGGTAGLVVTLRTGTCGSLTDSTVTLDLASTGTAAVVSTNTIGVDGSSNIQCVSVGVSRKTSGDPVAVFVNCSAERTSNSAS